METKLIIKNINDIKKPYNPKIDDKNKNKKR